MIIGLIGAPGAGKDVIGDFFVSKKGFKRLAFADKIKEGFYKESGLTEERFKNLRGSCFEKAIREQLWEYSAKKCSEFGPLYFISNVLNEITPKQSIVITDIRTELELKVLEEYGTDIVLILRNFKEELNGEFLPGTKLKISKVISYKKFWNIFDDVEETYKELEKFFIKIG